MTLQTLKNLPLVADAEQPISDSVKNFYLNTFAGGSGPDGTFVMTDFLGTASGANDQFSTVTAILTARTADGTLTDLAEIYTVMKNVIQGVYGDPTTGPVTIPPGLPGADTYTDGNLAIIALLPLATTEIGNVVVVMGSDTTTLNNAFTGMAQKAVDELNNQNKAQLNYATLTANDTMSALNLALALPSSGGDTAEGGAAEVLEGVANLSNATGQALIGAMREGRNQAQLDATRINRYDVVPDTPTSDPQATLLDSNYTVAEARAVVAGS
jgi:hypothetical protein